jgi:hypothetical protein
VWAPFVSRPRQVRALTRQIVCGVHRPRIALAAGACEELQSRRRRPKMGAKMARKLPSRLARRRRWSPISSINFAAQIGSARLRHESAGRFSGNQREQVVRAAGQCLQRRLCSALVIPAAARSMKPPAAGRQQWAPVSACIGRSVCLAAAACAAAWLATGWHANQHSRSRTHNFLFAGPV